MPHQTANNVLHEHNSEYGTSINEQKYEFYFYTEWVLRGADTDSPRGGFVVIMKDMNVKMISIWL